MPSVTYMNRSAPFWDFVASLEQEGTNHPFFNQWSPNRNDNDSAEARHETRQGPPEGLPFGPWGWGFPFGGGERGVPHRGPPPHTAHRAHHHRHEEHDEDRDFEKNFQEELNKEFEEDQETNEKKGEDNDNGEGPSGNAFETDGCSRGRGGFSSRRGRHGCGPRGWGGGHGSHGHGHGHGHSQGHGRRGGWGGWGRGREGPFGGNHPFNPLAFASSLFEPDQAKPAENEDFSPDADVFDTPTSFVIHVSLPGAKKEDVGVNWDVEKSELSIAGVIYRPGDEKLLEQLAMTERKVGAFERKIRLGTRANPANVDADQISAKLEDGVLRIDVPKLGENGFVEVRKVDIE